MFAGKKVVRFWTELSEATVVPRVRAALEALGRVSIDRDGSIDIEPRAGFRSPLTETAMGGRLSRRGNEFEVRITFTCAPTGAAWAIVAVGTPLLLLGWLALLAPLSARGRVARAVRQALHDAEAALQGVPGRRDQGAVGGPPH